MIRIVLTATTIGVALIATPLRADTYRPAPSDWVSPESGGLLLRSQDGTARWEADFGTPFHILMPALNTALGDGFEMTFQDECPAGPVIVVRYPNRFDLIFQEDHLQGWFLAREGITTTHSGLGWGSSVSFLEENFEVDRFDSTLGDEFTANGMSGILEGGMVAHLWAGTNCIFR